MRICSVNGCGLLHKGRGWCQKHYFRWKRSGDPLVTKHPVSRRGSLIEWINENTGFHGNGCLIWPFRSKMSNGYPLIWRDGKKYGGHRLMCELVNGHPPTSEHQAAHSCGMGSSGCIAPSHLRWATPKESNADKKIHGTSVKGEDIPWAKLTESDVRSIRSKFGFQSDIEISKIFNVSDSTIYMIRKGKNWRHVL